MIRRNQLVSLLLAAMAVAGAGCKKGSQPASDTGMASTSAGEVQITGVQLGRGVGANRKVTKQTDSFSPRDTIYASVLTNGTASNTTVSARWTYEGNQVVSEDNRTISPSGTEATEFHITKPGGWPKGKYQVTVTVGGNTQSKDFQVK
jgi:hypothetical protein